MSQQIQAVIIINFNDLKISCECLETVLKSKTSGFKSTIYLMNTGKEINGEIKNNQIILQKKYPQIIITTIENQGFSENNNFGIKQALSDGADEIVLLNNDTTVAPNSLQLLHEAIQDQTIGAISPKIYFSPGSEYHLDSYTKDERGKVFWYAGGLIDWANVYGYHRGVDEVDHGQFDQVEPTTFVTGCCLITRKDVLKKVGLLDKNYFLYWEDTDWSIRCQKAGFKLYYDPNAIIWHKNAGSTGGSGSTTHVYYQTRNRLMFGAKYAGFRTKIALAKQAINQINRNMLEKKAVTDYFFHHWGKQINDH